MAVSTSTIVFALITCVPFGLAIRDTVGDRGDHRSHLLASSDDELDPDLEDLERLEQRTRERIAREAEAEASAQAEKAAQQAQLRRLYGDEPATLGPALGGTV